MTPRAVYVAGFVLWSDDDGLRVDVTLRRTHPDQRATEPPVDDIPQDVADALAAWALGPHNARG